MGLFYIKQTNMPSGLAIDFRSYMCEFELRMHCVYLCVVVEQIICLVVVSWHWHEN